METVLQVNRGPSSSRIYGEGNFSMSPVDLCGQYTRPKQAGWTGSSSLEETETLEETRAGGQLEWSYGAAEGIKGGG